eukprot:UN01399
MTFLHLGKISFNYVFLCHFMGCFGLGLEKIVVIIHGWMMLIVRQMFHAEKRRENYKYVTSLYWAIVTISSDR